MNRKAILSVLLAGAMFAGCSQPAQTENSSSEKEGSTSQTQENTANKDEAPAALTSLALAGASGDDAAAQDAWKTVFKNFADSMNMQFMVETDGEDYLYDENNAHSMVKDNFIYDIGKETIFWKDGDVADNVQLTAVDDSYESLLMGYGTIDRLGTSPVMTYVTLNNTSDDKLEGHVKTIQTSDVESIEDGAINTLIDAAMDFGYVRAVNPVSNSSLYTYDLQKDGSDWKLSLSIKDLEAFKKKASVGGVLVNDRTDRPVLVLDNIQEETWTFKFDKDGILKEEENDIFHVINGISDEYTQKYMNLLNRASFKKAKADDIKPEAFTSFFDGCADGTIKDGDAFTIENWN